VETRTLKLEIQQKVRDIADAVRCPLHGAYIFSFTRAEDGSGEVRAGFCECGEVVYVRGCGDCMYDFMEVMGKLPSPSPGKSPGLGHGKGKDPFSTANVAPVPKYREGSRLLPREPHISRYVTEEHHGPVPGKLSKIGTTNNFGSGGTGHIFPPPGSKKEPDNEQDDESGCGVTWYTDDPGILDDAKTTLNDDGSISIKTESGDGWHEITPKFGPGEVPWADSASDNPGTGPGPFSPDGGIGEEQEPEQDFDMEAVDDDEDPLAGQDSLSGFGDPFGPGFDGFDDPFKRMP
jgi:hypothetical protein